VDLARARVAQHPDDLPGRGPADDRVVDSTIRLPSTTSRTGFSFTFTPKWRIAFFGSMKVRPT